MCVHVIYSRKSACSSLLWGGDTCTNCTRAMALLILLVFYNHPFDVNYVGCSQVFAINYYCYCYAALVCVCVGCCMQSSLHDLICAKTANGSGVFARTFFKYLRSLLQCKKNPMYTACAHCFLVYLFGGIMIMAVWSVATYLSIVYIAFQLFWLIMFLQKVVSS